MRPVIALSIAAVLCAQCRADGIALLNLRVVQGEGMTYGTGSRATRGITVEITDELARPVAGASVSFLLPDTGPSGTFANGGRNEIAVTGPDGRAAVWGMLWGRTAGRVDVRITAALGEVRAGTMASQTLVERMPRDGAASSGGKTKKILIIAGIAAAAAGAGAALGGRGKSDPAAPAGPPAPTIGGPTITIGRR